MSVACYYGYRAIYLLSSRRTIRSGTSVSSDFQVDLDPSHGAYWICRSTWGVEQYPDSIRIQFLNKALLFLSLSRFMTMRSHPVYVADFCKICNFRLEEIFTSYVVDQ